MIIEKCWRILCMLLLGLTNEITTIGKTVFNCELLKKNIYAMNRNIYKVKNSVIFIYLRDLR